MQSYRTAALFLLPVRILIHTSPAEVQKKKDKQCDQVSESYPDTIGINGLRFRSMGPALTLGRISGFAVHSTRPGAYYVADSSGGLEGY